MPEHVDVMEEPEPQQTLMHAAVSAASEREAEKKKKIKTRTGKAQVGGQSIDVVVQGFANTYVIIASMLPCPGYVVRCSCDGVEGIAPSASAYRTEALLGNDNAVLNVVGRQLLMATGGAKEVLLYFGIRPQLTDPDKPEVCKQTIRELLAAINDCKLW